MSTNYVSDILEKFETDQQKNVSNEAKLNQ